MRSVVGVLRMGKMNGSVVAGLVVMFLVRGFVMFLLGVGSVSGPCVDVVLERRIIKYSPLISSIRCKVMDGGTYILRQLDRLRKSGGWTTRYQMRYQHPNTKQQDIGNHDISLNQMSL